MKNRTCSTLLGSLLIILMGFMFNMNARAAEDPITMLQSLADQMIDGLKSNKASLKTNPSFVYSLARKVVVPHADLTEMSKRVLPPNIWNSASNRQKAEFEKEFTTLLVRTYASALSAYSDQTIKFYPIRGGINGKTNLKVDSQIIRSDGPAIPVSYKVLLNNSQWKVYDMLVEGVSLLESFRSQFSNKLSQGNIDSLTRDLATHNANNVKRDE